MISNKSDYKFYLKADLASNKIIKWKWRYRFTHVELYFQRKLRKVEFLKNCRNNPIGKLLYIFNKFQLIRLSHQLGFTIPLNVFGPGLSIAHYGSIVINGYAKVGKNCRIHSDVNIGESKGKSPHIGDNVYIGPGAKIYGEIVIGDNVAIGANAVVNKDIPSNVTVAGVPAKIISNIGSEGLLTKGADLV
jgi:serine O-acetyltransferase